LGIGDWGLGIGDWGLGIGPNPQSPIPNPQSPIPISQNQYNMRINFILLILLNYNLNYFQILILPSQEEETKIFVYDFSSIERDIGIISVIILLCEQSAILEQHLIPLSSASF